MNNELLFYKKMIKSNGYRFTTQKEIILLQIINVNTHLSVKDIYSRVKDRNIGLATVYRSLKIFTKLGIIKEINIDNVNYYEKKIFSGNPLHIHFKCSKCNSIIDINHKNLNLEYIKLNRKVEEFKDLEIYDANIMLMGICDKCKEEIRWRDQQNADE